CSRRPYGVGGGTMVDWMRDSTARRSSSHLAGFWANTSGAIQRVLQAMPVPEASGFIAILTWMRHAATAVTGSVGLGYRSPVRFPRMESTTSVVIPSAVNARRALAQVESFGTGAVEADSTAGPATRPAHAGRRRARQMGRSDLRNSGMRRSWHDGD